MIKDVPVEAILDAMKQFDTEYRNNGEWLNWQNNRIINMQRKRWPALSSKADYIYITGQPVSSFSGGDEANNYLIKRV